MIMDAKSRVAVVRQEVLNELTEMEKRYLAKEDLTKDDVFATKAREYMAYVKKIQRWPQRDTSDSEEKKYAKWFSNAKTRETIALQAIVAELLAMEEAFLKKR